MRSRASSMTVTLVLAICFVCPLIEIFDQWDHTLQTGDDTEYALIVLALCVGVAYSIARLNPRISLLGSLAAARADSCPHQLFPTLIGSSLIILIPERSPALALRI